MTVQLHNATPTLTAVPGTGKPGTFDRQIVRSEIRDTLRQDEPDLRRVFRLLALDIQIALDAEDAKTASAIGLVHEKTMTILKARAELDGSTDEDDGWDVDPSLLADESDGATVPQDVVPDGDTGTGRAYSLPVATVREIVSLVLGGMSKADVVRTLGVSKRSVMRYSKKHIDLGEPLPDQDGLDLGDTGTESEE